MSDHLRTAPGAVLLRWPTLAALALLACNDHWWKAAYGSVVTGKLSGVAALVLCPLIAVGAAEVVLGRQLQHRSAVRLAAWTGVGAALAIALTETTAWGLSGYELLLGALRWPLDAVASLLAGHGLPTVRRAVQHQDLTDLLTLPAAALPAWWLATRHSRVRISHRSGKTGLNSVDRR